MAKLLGWLLFLGALFFLILFVWGSAKEKNAPPLPVQGSTYRAPEPTIPPPTPVPGWTPRGQQPAAQPAQNPGIQVPSRGHLALQSQGMDWQNIARNSGCELVGFSREGDRQVITLEAPSHANFNQFLEAVRRTGRLIDPGNANMQQFNKNGRVVLRTTYRLQIR